MLKITLTGQLFRQALYLEAQNHMTAKNNERKKKYSSSVCGCEAQCLLFRSFSRCLFAKTFCSSTELHKSGSDVCTFVQNSLVATYEICSENNINITVSLFLQSMCILSIESRKRSRFV